MKQILTIIAVLFCLSTSAQFTNTGSKTRFVNGIGLSASRTSGSYNTADSLVLFSALDSTLMFKYKGTARALAYAVSGGYVAWSDTGRGNSQIVTGGSLNKVKDSVQANINLKSSSSQSGTTVIDMHYGLLKGTGLLSSETAGTNVYNVATKAAKGATSIILSANASITGSYPLVAGQLMVYGGYSGKWFTTKIASISGVTITTANPLEDSIPTGQYVTNFYINESHPNAWGYYALADYAIRTAKTQWKVETRFNINTALGSGVVSSTNNNSVGNPGSTQITSYTVTSTTALTDGITATFNVNSTGSHLLKFVVNTLGNSVRARVTYNGINYDTTFNNSQPSSVDLPLWVSADNRSVTVSLAATSNGGQFILNENVAVLKVSGFSPNLNAQKHVLLGDSWFAQYYLDLRIRDVLTNATIINAGNGGYTAQQLIDVFNTQVSPYNPNVVWLIVGTNDYYQGVTYQTYSANINRLKFMCDSIGAHLLLFTSSVGSAQLDTTRFKRSREYANLAKLADENIGLNDSTFVPFTGAIKDVDLGSKKLLTGQLNVSGAGNDARVAYSGSLGMYVQGKAATESDFSILKAGSGAYAYRIPTGTGDGIQHGSFSAIFQNKSSAADSFLVVSGSATAPVEIKHRTASQMRTDLGVVDIYNTQTNIAGAKTWTDKQTIKYGTSGATPESNVSYFVIENSAAAGMSILTPDANGGRISFGTASNNRNAQIYADYNGGAQTMLFNVGTGATGASERMRLTANAITAAVPVTLKGYTVATLPTGVTGMTAYVTDALAPTFLAAVVGGGAVVCPVFYNGTAWVAH